MQCATKPKTPAVETTAKSLWFSSGKFKRVGISNKSARGLNGIDVSIKTQSK